EPLRPESVELARSEASALASAPEIKRTRRGRPCNPLEGRNASARALFEAREKAGLTQEQLAERIGTTSSNIGRWERGERRPDGLEWMRMQEVLPTLPDLWTIVRNFLSVGIPQARDSEDVELLRELPTRWDEYL